MQLKLLVQDLFLKGKFAELERALMILCLTYIQKIWLQEISPPLIASEAIQCTEQVNFLNLKMISLKLNLMMKKIKYLIPTAEVILTNMIKAKQLKKETSVKICSFNSLF